MPYFPKSEDARPYKCPGCGGSFYPSNVSCSVLHPPGTCCHEYETRDISTPGVGSTSTVGEYVGIVKTHKPR